MVSELRLAVRGTLMEALNEAEIQGVTMRFLGYFGDDRVFAAPIQQFDRVVRWWCMGQRLVRTLGPFERVQSKREV